MIPWEDIAIAAVLGTALVAWLWCLPLILDKVLGSALSYDRKKMVIEWAQYGLITPAEAKRLLRGRVRVRKQKST